MRGITIRSETPAGPVVLLSRQPVNNDSNQRLKPFPVDQRRDIFCVLRSQGDKTIVLF